MKLSTLTNKIVEVFKAEFRLFGSEVTRLGSEFLEKIFSLNALTISMRYPPLPKLFEFLMDLAFGMMDAVQNAVPRTIALVGATIVVDQISTSAPNGVMELKKVALFPVKVIVEYGIREVASGLPNEWLIVQKIERARKFFSFVKFPSWLKGWKLIAGNAWSRIITLILTLMKCAELFGLVALLWRYGRILNDSRNAEMLFSAKLFQNHPRQRQRVKILRRVGGVRP